MSQFSAAGLIYFADWRLKKLPKQVQIPRLDPGFINDRNPDKNWLVERFNDHMRLLDRLAGSLPQSLPWRTRTVEEFRNEVDRLKALGRSAAVYGLLWQDMLDQIQAFGLLSAWRLVELVSSAVWAIRRDDPLCAAIMARAALETSASYTWFQIRFRPGINSAIGKDLIVEDMDELEKGILKTLWASKLEDFEVSYNPTNIITIIDHITNKIPDQEDVGPCYRLLCEVAHPNMLGRSLFLSEEGGRTVISRKRGPSVKVIEQASMLALSWAAATLPLSLTPMQDTCIRMMQDLGRITQLLQDKP